MLDVKCNFVEMIVMAYILYAAYAALYFRILSNLDCSSFSVRTENAKTLTRVNIKRRTSPISVNSASLKFELSFY
jgi:hypothetical protein